MTDQLSYFRKRLLEERQRAERADRAEVRRVHLELAALYSAKLAEAEPPVLRVVA